MGPDDFDMDAGVSQIVEGLGFEAEEDPPPVDPPAEAPDTPAAPDAAAPPVAPVTRAAPQSWAKETHELWGKLPPEAQDQIERREKQMLEGLGQYKEFYGVGKSLHEAIAPFSQVLQSQGIEAPKAVSYLLAAHQRLTTGSEDQRRAAYQQLGEQLGLSAPSQGDPAARAALELAQNTHRFIQDKQKEQFEKQRTATAKEVETFAADPAHPYFDEVADDIIVMIAAGHPLKDAYDKAVWANPVTRAKETARLQQETEKQLREKGKQDAEAARKARSANVRSQDTRKASTEPLGKMDDTLKQTLDAINSRPH